MRIAAALAAVVLLALPSAGQRSVLRLPWWTDVGLPTPFTVSMLGPGGVVRLTLLYDTLVWKDAHGLIPWLAAHWRVTPDGRAYVFTLRPDVRWHDGTMLTARDVKFSLEYYRRHPFRWIDTSIINAVEARDRHTVIVRLARKHAPFLEHIAGIVPIIPEHIWKDVDHPERVDRLQIAVGSGPYRLMEYRPESGQYRLTAHEGYFRGRPVIDEIQYLLVPPERQVLAVQNGQVDAAMATTYDVVRAFEAHPYLRVLETEPLSIARLIFNLDDPVTGQRAFRHAVAYALDRGRIADIATRGRGLPGSAGVVPPGDAWFNPSVPRYAHDLNRARSLLRGLGYTHRDRDGWLERSDGSRLRVDLLASPTREMELIAQMLQAAGIEVRTRIVDPATRAQLAAEGRFAMLYATHIGSGGDPDYLRAWFTGADANLFAAGGSMRHPEFLRLAQQQLDELDPFGRRRLIDRMQRFLGEELPTLPLYYRPFFWIYDSRKISPIATRGGLLNGIPLLENKLAFLSPGGR